MSHTMKVIAGGVLLLALCLFVGRALAGAQPSAGLASGARVFLVLWLIAAAVNLWFGVARAGYTLAEEAPIFLVVYGVPAAVAVLILWRMARG